MRIEDVLQDAAEVMEDLDWAQGTMARDGEGKEVAAINPAAVSICVTGAVYRATLGCGSNGRALVRKVALRWVERATGYAPSLFNDAIAKDKDEVVAALRKAAVECAAFHGSSVTTVQP